MKTKPAVDVLEMSKYPIRLNIKTKIDMNEINLLSFLQIPKNIESMIYGNIHQNKKPIDFMFVKK